MILDKKIVNYKIVDHTRNYSFIVDRVSIMSFKKIKK